MGREEGGREGHYEGGDSRADDQEPKAREMSKVAATAGGCRVDAGLLLDWATKECLGEGWIGLGFGRGESKAMRTGNAQKRRPVSRQPAQASGSARAIGSTALAFRGGRLGGCCRGGVNGDTGVLIEKSGAISKLCVMGCCSLRSTQHTTGTGTAALAVAREVSRMWTMDGNGQHVSPWRCAGLPQGL
jgi:hypothetical protein